MRVCHLLVCLLSVLGLGCALGRDTVKVEVPAAAQYPASRYSVAIDPPRDARHFQNKPPSADLPSADGDIAKIEKGVLSALIGRKRNTYGKALGDIVLPKGESVETKTTEILTEAMRRRGVNVSSSGRRCTATINEFWSWFRPGFWQVAVEARIKLNVVVDGPSGRKSFDVMGFGRCESMAAGPSEFRKAYRLAIEDVLKQLDDNLLKAGFTP